jgi:hypothetical protein
MQVVEHYDKWECDNCGKWTYIFKIETDDGECQLRLCKECLLKLLDAIVRR